MGNSVTKEKLLSLQALRALAFIGVFLSHCGISMFDAAGAWGVSVFLVLSGFLMMFTYEKRLVGNRLRECLVFAVNKIKKLYPLHILMILFVLPFVLKEIVRYQSLEYVVIQVKYLICNVLLVQTWIPNSAVYFSMNSVAWYLSLCMFIYFMFPHIKTKINKYKDVNSAYVNIILIYIVQILAAYVIKKLVEYSLLSSGIMHWFTYVFPIYRLGDFIIGCNLGYIYLNKKEKNIRTKSATIIELFTVLLIVAAQIIYVKSMSILGDECFKYSVLFLPLSVMLVYMMAINKGLFSKIITNKVVIYIGNMSGYAFLVHQLLIRYWYVIAEKVHPILYNKWIMVLSVFSITMLLAQLYVKVSILIKQWYTESKNKGNINIGN